MLIKLAAECCPQFSGSYAEGWNYSLDRGSTKSGKQEKTNFKNNATFLILKPLRVLGFRNTL